MDKRHDTGKRGETAARTYLENHGYEIIATNYRNSGGEIDIIARASDTLIFVEVRTSEQDGTESAFASVTPRKRQRMMRAVSTYLENAPVEPASWRVDIIAVYLPRHSEPIIEHAEDALDW